MKKINKTRPALIMVHTKINPDKPGNKQGLPCLEWQSQELSVTRHHRQAPPMREEVCFGWFCKLKVQERRVPAAQPLMVTVL